MSQPTSTMTEQTVEIEEYGQAAPSSSPREENAASANQPRPRYNPVPIRGEPLSVTIMRDRGSL